jgi:hypothetical protein
MSKGGILSIFIDLKDGAEGFHSSKFDSAELVAGCGSLFNPGLVIEAADLIEMETSTCGVSYEVSEKCPIMGVQNIPRFRFPEFPYRSESQWLS